ncbi:DsbA family protein [Parafilimonas terrae]|uniref:Thioredoxin n=1 Tax=Parafilimonas terrae TaxID=1465490 RepID=A0A1I5V5Y4_9BACT|nr:thioredoxin domain-containing protein [Parafilimonas terrae]SFQ02944.1 Thioredoxin [Parafilimonas terrae]
MKQLIPVINSNDHIYGNEKALIELVEYGDYQCPYCGLAYPIVKNIQQELGADLKFVFRNFPLSKVHPFAFAAAVATEAAALQNKFWEMHDIIFENQERLNIENIIVFAENIGLDLQQFKYNIQQKEQSVKVERDFESGLRSGVNRTPSFYINGNKYEGEWRESELLQYMQGLLIAAPETAQYAMLNNQ